MLDYLLPIQDANKRSKIATHIQDGLVLGSNQRWNLWTQGILPILSKSQESRQLYMENRPEAEVTNKPDDVTRSRVRRPVIAQAIDSTIAQQHLASFPTDESFFKGRPKNKLAADRLPTYEKYCEQRLAFLDFILHALKARVSKALDGTVAVWFPYGRSKKVEVTYDFPTLFGLKLPLGKPRAIEKEVVDFEGTDFVPLNLEDWRIDPTATRFSETNFIWRRWVTVEQLQNVKALANTEDLKPYGKCWGAGGDDSAIRKQQNYRLMGIEPTFLGDDNGVASQMVLLQEEWGDFYFDGKYYHNYVLIYSNDCTFHYFDKNPHHHAEKPFGVSPYIPLPDTLYGKSQAQDIIPLAHAGDSLVNNAIEAIKVTGTPTFTYRVTDTSVMEFFGDGPVSLVAGEGIPVQDHTSIAPVVWDRQALQEVSGLLQMLKEEIRESTGGVSYATGGITDQGPDRTATETNALVSGTSTRFQLLLLLDEILLYKPFLNQTISNDKQYMSAEAFVADEDKPLTPNEIKLMMLIFDVTGSKTVMNRAKELQDYDGFLQNYLPGLIKNNLASDNGDKIIFNIPELMKRRMSMSSMRDLDSFMEIKTAQELQQEQQEQAAQMTSPPPMGALPPEMIGAPDAVPTVPGTQPNGAPRDMAPIG